MARPYVPDPDVLDLAHELVTEAKSSDSLRRALCVTLSSDLGLEASQIAAALQLSLSTVYRYRRDFVEMSWQDQNQLGGRWNRILSEEEEQKFLSKWFDKARKGEAIFTIDIHNELRGIIGYEIPFSATSRMLRRNGFRRFK